MRDEVAFVSVVLDTWECEWWERNVGACFGRDKKVGEEAVEK